MIKEGNKAPAFTLPSSTGRSVSLKHFAGKTVILYFYPRDNTPGCTTEAIDFRDAAAELDRKGAVVLGVSRDSIQSHQKFIDKHDLGFLLLSDPEAKVIDKYGAWGEKNNYGKKSLGIIRTTVVIRPDGRVHKVFPKVRVKGHVAQVLETLDAARAAAVP